MQLVNAERTYSVSTHDDGSLEITGVGYKAEPKPYGLLFALGYSHQIEFKAPADVEVVKAPVLN